MRPTQGTSKIGFIRRGAGWQRLLDARVNVVDGEIGHPAFRYTVELGRIDRENADRLPASEATQ